MASSGPWWLCGIGEDPPNLSSALPTPAKIATTSKMRRPFAVILVFFLATLSARANTFTVINTADSGAGSLRQAISDANNHAGADTIAFNISGAGVHTIAPLSGLPAFTETVTIDGYTQPTASANTLPSGDNANLLIELNGTNAGSGVNGLTVSANNCTIRGLVINRFSRDGIQIDSGVSGNLIEGNFIGTDVNGAAAAPNLNSGVIVLGNGNTIGGTAPAARNLISGNGDATKNFNGIRLEFANNNLVEGNIIGLDHSGVNVIANQGNGISDISGASNTFGGAAGGAGNLISGNALNGIVVQDVAGATTGTGTLTLIAGNRIGTDVTGTLDRGNVDDGVLLVQVTKVTVGGTTAGAANLLSGNDGNGVRLVQNANNNVIRGNFIGTDATRTLSLGNALAGVLVEDATSTGNTVQGNSIFSNGSLGIDLNADGVTLNDTGDGDTGANNLQNFPVLESVSNSGGMTNISGRLNSAASTMYRIEFFANDTIDSTGYGEGQTYLGFENVPTDGGGNGSINKSFPQIGAGQRVTATATDPSGNTSEFSGAIGQLLNVSTRMQVLTGSSVLIGGFIIGGTGSKDVLLRALGPTLQNFGIIGFLADPTMDLYSGQTLLASNDNWKSDHEAEISATGKAPPNDLEPAIRQSLAPGSYTAIVRGKNNTTGVGLVEAYDLDNLDTIILTNISTRGFVDINQNVMIGGCISGNGIVRVIVRALGPTLSQFGVANVLADPVLDVRDAQGNSLATNDNWKDTQQAEIQASGKAPPNDKESAIIIVRPAGNTTAIVSGKGGTTGNALVEVYILPP
jgi:hypothetical protein